MSSRSSPMIFLRTGWMDRYRGLTLGDEIRGGGSFVAEHGFGHEIFNFLPFEGQVFGYVQPPGAAHNDESERTININRLGAANGDRSVSGVLAVWVATRPGGGMVIVGWYKNATISRDWQKPPGGSQRSHQGKGFGYYITAAAEDATLLPKDERLVLLAKGKGGMGQSNVWYADRTGAHEEFRQMVQSYVTTRHLPPPLTPPDRAKSADPFIRQLVERAAVAETDRYYTGLGYGVGSVEKDNLGWDLNAVHPTRGANLKLEVKGLSGNDLCVEVTPNEYARMNEHRDVYRLCVVTDALGDPQLTIFAYSTESQRWEDNDGRLLGIEEIVAARCRLAE
jgi:hypothetical protein